MGIAEDIARKRSELAAFVTGSAPAVPSGGMSEDARGAVAIDLLRLMVASGLQAQTAHVIDVTPKPAVVAERPKAIARPVAPPSAESLVESLPKARGRGGRKDRSFTDEQLIEAVGRLKHS